MPKPPVGSIGWIDLTAPDATKLRDFYKATIGWEHVEAPVDDYFDFCVGADPANDPVAGICHARGINKDLPAQWLIYIVVADIKVSLENCEANGGTILNPVRQMGEGKAAVIRDPAGAVCALFEPGN